MPGTKRASSPGTKRKEPPKKQSSTHSDHELYSFFGIGVTLLFSIMSVAMVLANKCVVAIRPQDSASMLLYQVAFTAIAMSSYAFLYNPSFFSKRQMLSWTPCAALFTCNIVTSAMALEYITVPTFSVLRNVQPFISTLLGVYLVPRLNTSIPSEPTSLFKLYALLLILIGTAIYAWKDVEFELNGYLWVLGHISSMSLYVSLVKSKGGGSDELPASAMSLYNNILALPLLVFIYYFNLLPLPHTSIPSSVQSQCAAIAPASTWTHFSAVASVVISITAFSSQKLMTGTAFVTLNNINKVPGLFLSHLFFSAVLEFPMVVGLALSLVSAFLFALFSDTKKSISNHAVFQMSLVFFIVSTIFLYSGFKFAALFQLDPIPLQFIGIYAPAVIKALPALLMSLLIFCSTPGPLLFQRPASYVALALAFSACGDFALELPDIANSSTSLKSQLFMVGMAFFAMAQWFFITAFSLNHVPIHPSRAVAPYALAFAALFAMKDGIMKEAASDIGLGVGIVFYAILLAGCAWRASARVGFTPAQTQFNPIMLFKQQTVTAAAFVFMLSDLLIAWGKFHADTGVSGHALVMTLYWLAQGLYTASMLHYEATSGMMRAVGGLLFVSIAASVLVAHATYGREVADVSSNDFTVVTTPHT